LNPFDHGISAPTEQKGPAQSLLGWLPVIASDALPTALLEFDK
jgi:hypothetical protein